MSRLVKGIKQIGWAWFYLIPILIGGVVTVGSAISQIWPIVWASYLLSGFICIILVAFLTTWVGMNTQEEETKP